jgi:hypothetical protein
VTTATRDLERELREWDGTWPECWKPKPGDILVGTVERYSTGQTMYGPCRTVILRRDDGERVSLWLSSKVLLSQFEQHQPRVGERVGVRYHGKHPERGYKRFSLLVDRDQPAEPDFSPIGGERDDTDDGFEWEHGQ